MLTTPPPAPASTPAPPPTTTPVAELIVIGCDGSDAGRPAVVFAVQEALLRGARLLAVAAYDVPAMAYGWGMSAAAYGDLPLDLEQATEQAVRRQIEEVRAEHGGTVDLEVRVAQGRPSALLLAASVEAALLVVGARGLHAWGRVFLGSTSTEVVHHATVPVVVVPSPSTRHDDVAG